MPKIMIEVDVDKDYCHIIVRGHLITCPHATNLGCCKKYGGYLDDNGAYIRVQTCKELEVKA